MNLASYLGRLLAQSRVVVYALGLFALLGMQPTRADMGPLFSGIVDPPLHVTNESGQTVRLVWQTVEPGVRLSPPRSAEIPAGAKNKRIAKGLYWILSGDSPEGVFVDNVVFLSIADDSGGYKSQVPLKAEVFTQLDDLRKVALGITIGTDGSIRAKPRLDQ